mgnify:CR=1 FL=1
MKILFAEDDLILQKLHGEFLDNLGYSFDIASNCLEAVALALKNEGQYDLCLMDVEMPKMNGIEATKLIRRSGKHIPIIACSSNNNYKNACYKAGMDDFINKPCPYNVLFTKINELLEKP